MADARLEAAAAAVLTAPHSGKGSVVAALAATLGCSLATAHRRLRPLLAPLRQRKPRADSGQSALSRAAALVVAGLIEETRRLTGTGALPVGNALEILRANGEISTARVDTATGEIIALSNSAILRALRHYGCHPDQLAATTPAVRLSSPHPNWCWQVDASVSRQFYLADDGARTMPKQEFYRGKPQNFARIAERRIWRYVVTDHASGCIELFYVQGAESAANLISALIHTMTCRPGGTMHGVPNILMTDPGSAMTATPTATFCAALDIQLQINQVGNARAKGQVENAQYLVEVHFEAALKLRAPITSIAEINKLAQDWARGYNATKVHSRTGVTRRDAWLRITTAQLRLAPAVSVLRQLPTTEPKLCVVRDAMIRYRGGVFDVRDVPGLINGDKIRVIVNALDAAGSVRVLVDAEGEGKPAHYLAPRVGADSYGFLDSAYEIGSKFGALKNTPADVARTEIDRLVMAVETDAEAKAARKAKRLPFGGRIDPLKHLRAVDAAIVPALPRAGVVSAVEAPAVLAATRIAPAPAPRREFDLVAHEIAAMRIKRLLESGGQSWQPSMYALIQQRWPDGVPYDQVEALAAELATPVHGGLRLVDGGAA